MQASLGCPCLPSGRLRGERVFGSPSSGGTRDITHAGSYSGRAESKSLPQKTGLLARLAVLEARPPGGPNSGGQRGDAQCCRPPLSPPYHLGARVRRSFAEAAPQGALALGHLGVVAASPWPLSWGPVGAPKWKPRGPKNGPDLGTARRSPFCAPRCTVW